MQALANNKSVFSLSWGAAPSASCPISWMSVLDQELTRSCPSLGRSARPRAGWEGPGKAAAPGG